MSIDWPEDPQYEDPENMCVDDDDLEYLINLKLVRRDGDDLIFMSKPLEYHCKCGDWLTHHFACGGLYVPCEKCKVNTILYFTIHDLLRCLKKGSVRVKEEAQ